MKNRQIISNNLPDNEKYTEELFFSIGLAFEPMKVWFRSMWETEKNYDTAVMGEAMYERAMTKLDEMEKAVKEQIGEIKLTKATRCNSQSIRTGTLLSVKVD